MASSLSSSSSISSSFFFTSRQAFGLQEGKWDFGLPSKAFPQGQGSIHRAVVAHGATVGSPRSRSQGRPRAPVRQDRPRAPVRQDRPRAPVHQDRPRAPVRKRLWKEGLYPGTSDSSVASPPRTPIKNHKKKMDDKKAAKAWVPTVTECLGERIAKMQWQEALEVLVVRNDLKMGKGKIGAQCSHATLGLYKKLIYRAPKALERWEMCGQVKVVLKVETENELLSLQEKAKSLKLPTHITIDAGRTQIAPNSRTVMALLGPADVVDDVTGGLKLL